MNKMFCARVQMQPIRSQPDQRAAGRHNSQGSRWQKCGQNNVHEDKQAWAPAMKSGWQHMAVLLKNHGSPISGFIALKSWINLAYQITRLRIHVWRVSTPSVFQNIKSAKKSSEKRENLCTGCASTMISTLLQGWKPWKRWEPFTPVKVLTS